MSVRGRVVVHAEGARPLLAPGASAPQKKRILLDEMQARIDAERILADASAEAEATLASVREAAAREARDAEQAKLAAAWLALRAAQASEDERRLERTTALAVLVAERLVGAALELHPDRVATLAKTALAEARGARRVAIDAHPLDMEALRAHLDDLARGGVLLELRADESLARGDLRLHTDLGTLDARLTPRLDRLVAAVKDALR